MDVNINRIENENNYEDGINVINNRKDKGSHCRQMVLSKILEKYKNHSII